MRTDVIHLALGPEQIEKLIFDLTQCLKLKAGSAIIISTNNPNSAKVMEEIFSNWQSNGATLKEVPEPTIAAVNHIWTIGLPTSIERLAEVYEQWSNADEDRRGI